jgi:hypothetical protein
MAVGEGGGDSAPGPIVMKSRRCECVVLEKKAEGRFFFFYKNHLHRRWSAGEFNCKSDADP